MDDAKIEKLNSKNYRHWRMRMQGILEVKGCWDAVDPGYEAPLTEAQKKLDHRAKSLFYLSVNDEGLDDIADCTSGKEIWKTLADIHTKYDTWHGLLLIRDFVNLQKTPEDSIGDYLTKRSTLYHQVKNAGFEFDEKAVAGFALLGLPKEFEFVARNIRADKDELKMTVLKAKLIEEERRINGCSATSANCEDDSKALFSKNKTQEFVSKKPHYKKMGSNPKSYEHVKCFSCLEFGHISKNCPVKSKSINVSQASLVTNKAVNHLAFVAKEVSNFKHRASVSSSVLMCGTKSNEKTWVLDSGVTDHMTFVKNKFTSVRYHRSLVELANGELIEAHGSGEVLLKLSDENGGCSITLKDVLYVPKLGGNLMSISRIAEKNLKVVLDYKHAHIKTSDEIVVATAFKNDRLYKFVESEDVVCAQLTNVSNAQNPNTTLWHRRMGHVHVTALKKIGCNVNLSVDDEQLNDICGICHEGKMRAKPFPRMSTSKASKPLKLVHSDVMGPISPESKGGNRRNVENEHEHRIAVLRTDNGGEYKSKEFCQKLSTLGIERQYTIPGTPQQNGIAERMNQFQLAVKS